MRKLKKVIINKHGNNVLYFEDGLYLYSEEYNKNGILIEKTEYKNNKKTCIDNFDEKGHLFLFTRYYEDGKTISFIAEYGDIGRTKTTHYKPDGTIDYIEELKTIKTIKHN